MLPHSQRPYVNFIIFKLTIVVFSPISTPGLKIKIFSQKITYKMVVFPPLLLIKNNTLFSLTSSNFFQFLLGGPAQVCIFSRPGSRSASPRKRARLL